MGTRGFIGIVTAGGEVKTTYNHFDSYPDGVGVDVLDQVRTLVIEHSAYDLSAIAERIVVVEEDAPVIAKHAERLAEVTDTSVGGYSDLVYYQALRGAQGRLDLLLKYGVMTDGSHFPTDSLFCEWGYLLDLENRTFDVYRGFQQTVPVAGRWAGMSGTNGYHAVERIASYPLNALPDNDAFVAQLNAIAYPEDAEV